MESITCLEVCDQHDQDHRDSDWFDNTNSIHDHGIGSVYLAVNPAWTALVFLLPVYRVEDLLRVPPLKHV